MSDVVNKNWEYGGFYKNHKMDGVIALPNSSKVKVCDIIDEMPEFMKDADCLFIDPPCSKGNLRSFYTKSDLSNVPDFPSFQKVLFRRIQEINPKHLFIEVFKSNKNSFYKQCDLMFSSVCIYDSFYYRQKNRRCWILHCTNESDNYYYEELNNIDEEQAIKWICTNHKFNCIGDLCMGRGLVGKYSYLNNRKFAGTELNKKRLAVLVEFISKKENNEL